LREGRGEQILPGETPEHPATQPRSDSRRKEGRGGAVNRATAGGDRSLNSLWTYETPFEAMAQIKDYVAFYPDRVDEIS
jgi:hypothetical protein